MIFDNIPTPITTDSAQKTIAEVFRQSEYQRSLSRTLWQQIVEWIADVWRAFGGTLDRHPELRFALLAVVLAGAVTSIGRELYRRRMGDSARITIGDRGRNGSAQDPWTVAHNEARSGRYLEAAHALYLAVLEAIASTDRISIDSAKTVGDYSRELRRKQSDALPLYREFARTYEPIVWGSGECDRTRFDLLSGIASRLTGRSS